ncbi:DUF6703 family protein [Leekyejoonella antrihumi]|uniref:Uncharacterized protein n=1 Tax=Leekyejoonella antrihumi TaxID=1660198 RepID=A0A563DVS5_9MICO|nr:DUF6703 family protein [Leekyejoonella antrihumi]TWP34042.1 hypothetical protein FGL98_18915 [Leekyejoonella antrihumi]
MPVEERPSVQSSPLRVRAEHLSDPLIQRLARLPKATPVITVLVVMVIGVIFRHVVGAVCFGLCALLIAWLLYLAWPRLSPIERMMRAAMLLLLTAIAVVLAA